MQRSIYFLVVFLFPIILNAQINTRLGAKPGLSLANQDWKFKATGNSRETNIRPGIYFGLFSEFGLSNKLSIVADLGYVQKGSVEKVEITTIDQPEGTGEFVKFDSRFDFVSFSPALQFSSQMKKIRPFAFVGPRLDYYLGYKSDHNLDALKDDFSNTIFGISAGIGAGYKHGKIEVSLNLQYQYDFNHLLDYISLGGQGLTIDNNTFIISLGCAYVLN